MSDWKAEDRASAIDTLVAELSVTPEFAEAYLKAYDWDARTCARYYPACGRHWQSLAEKAKVSLYYYNSRSRGTTNGLTTFHFTWEAEYQYRYNIRHAATPDGKQHQLILAVTPSISSLTVRVTHDVHLPAGYSLNTPWFKRLFYHELDHVAISYDERPRFMFLDLGWRAHQKELTVVLETQDSQAALQKLVKRKYSGTRLARLSEQTFTNYMDDLKEKVVALIREHYVVLDEISDHGDRPIPDRPNWLASLYDEAHIRGMKCVKNGKAVHPDLLAPVFASRPYGDYKEPYLVDFPHDYDEQARAKLARLKGLSASRAGGKKGAGYGLSQTEAR